MRFRKIGLEQGYFPGIQCDMGGKSGPSGAITVFYSRKDDGSFQGHRGWCGSYVSLWVLVESTGTISGSHRSAVYIANPLERIP